MPTGHTGKLNVTKKLWAWYLAPYLACLEPLLHRNLTCTAHVLTTSLYVSADISCRMRVSHGSVYEDYHLLECDTVWFDTNALNFIANCRFLPQYRGTITLKKKSSRFLRNVVAYLIDFSLCYMPEDIKLRSLAPFLVANGSNSTNVKLRLIWSAVIPPNVWI